MNIPPGSWKLKYLRAREHLEQLRADHEWFIEGRPASFTPDVDRKTGEHFFTITRLDNLPAKWPTLVGDCLQNFRAALNHLIWELDTRKPADRDESLEFPIFRSPPKADAWAKRTGSLPTPTEAVIKALQPCYRSQLDPTSDPLWWLHELARIDRHRHLHFAIWWMEGSSILGREGVQSFPPRALKVGTEIARFDWSEESDPDMQFYHSFGVAFVEEPVRDQSVLTTLDQIRDHVSDALDRLAEHLPSD